MSVKQLKRRLLRSTKPPASSGSRWPAWRTASSTRDALEAVGGYFYKDKDETPCVFVPDCPSDKDLLYALGWFARDLITMFDLGTGLAITKDELEKKEVLLSCFQGKHCYVG